MKFNGLGENMRVISLEFRVHQEVKYNETRSRFSMHLRRVDLVEFGANETRMRALELNWSWSSSRQNFPPRRAIVDQIC